ARYASEFPLAIAGTALLDSVHRTCDRKKTKHVPFSGVKTKKSGGPMERSSDRILTTHVGSLPRSPQLIEAMGKIERGEMEDRGAFERLVDEAVAAVVGKQAELGIDIVDDGEVGKVGFITYINERLGGFEPLQVERKSTWDDTKEALAFPEFY